MEVVLVLHVEAVCTHLLNQMPYLNVLAVLMTTVRLVAMVNPLEHVLLATTSSTLLEVLALLARMIIVMPALELEKESVHHALLAPTC